MLLSRYWDLCIQVAKGSRGEAVRLEVYLVTAASKILSEEIQFMHVLALPFYDIIGNPDARPRASSNDWYTADVEVLHSVENELHEILTRHSVIDDNPLDFGRAIPFRAVHLLPRIDAALNSDSPDVSESAKTPPAR